MNTTLHSLKEVPATNKVFLVIEKLREKPINYVCRNNRYYFNYKRHELFFQKKSDGTMLFGIPKCGVSFVLPKGMKKEFYKLVPAELALDDILIQGKRYFFS
jgi:hypothetical protein